MSGGTDEVAAVSNLLIKKTQELLDSISNKNFDMYRQLCDATLTAFEPEACGHLIHGLKFHKHYFDHGDVRDDVPPLIHSCNVNVVSPFFL